MLLNLWLRTKVHCKSCHPTTITMNPPKMQSKLNKRNYGKFPEKMGIFDSYFSQVELLRVAHYNIALSPKSKVFVLPVLYTFRLQHKVKMSSLSYRLRLVWEWSSNIAISKCIDCHNYHLTYITSVINLTNLHLQPWTEVYCRGGVLTVFPHEERRYYYLIISLCTTYCTSNVLWTYIWCIITVSIPYMIQSLTKMSLQGVL